MTMQQDYLGFVLSQVTHQEQTAYRTEYPDIQYPRLVPVDTSAAEWARSITHFSTGITGQAEILANRANDIPLADITRAKHEVPVEMAAIGYDYTIEEIGQALMVPGTNLQADKAIAARRAAEEFIDDTVLTGNADYGWDGLINNTSVTAVDVPVGAGGSREWDSKTGDEIIKDINDAITGVWVDTKTVGMANTIALPQSAIALISTRRLPDTNISVMEYLRQHNVYTQMTRSPLMFVLLRGLEDAASGSKGRMIAYRRDPSVLKLHLPMPFRFEAPQRWLLRYIVPGIFRLGGLEIRLPKEVRYGDQITS